ncbi:MAG: ATP-dependent Clp protease ATP-binding subunit [Bacteroidales bacterium]|nr:ATP-dependent Clp protease ATP-binding subunit [Bacteroidales bacterium]
MQFAISEALNVAVQYQSPYIGVEHIMLGILRYIDKEPVGHFHDWWVHVVSNLGSQRVREELEDILDNNRSREDIPVGDIKQNMQAENILRLAFLISVERKASKIEDKHFVLAILKDGRSNVVKMLLEKKGITYDSLYTHVDQEEECDMLRNAADEGFRAALDMYSNIAESSSPPTKKGNNKSNNKGSSTPILDSFGKDLTHLAATGKLDPTVGREKELERITQILSRRKKNNPVLIGEPGVGKSAIAEGLALRIVEGKVSRMLIDKRIITLDMASLLAGTKYRGQLEERVKAILSEIESNSNLILFIDELHTMIGAGSTSGSAVDIANMFKPALARGEMQCIGATTLDEYRQYIETDGALERRFQKIMVEPTSLEETTVILNNIKCKYEDHHLVTYSNEAIQACVSLSNRYITDRHLPDKAIDVLDEVGARVHIFNLRVPQGLLEIEQEIETLQKLKNDAIKEQQYGVAATYRDQIRQEEDRLAEVKKEWETENSLSRPVVTGENVAEVIAMMTGVPVQSVAKNEKEKLLNMATALAGKVIGQDDAIRKISKAILRNRAGLKDPNKPIGVFIFLGQTGVGKTYLAKILAEYMFDSIDTLIRFDMSEFQEAHSVSRLIGSPPGYVGYEEGGQLTEKVRRKPYSIVLLDEIEKAHRDVYNVLLQVFDEGVLTDGAGRKVDFKNTIVIMTSNIGSRELKDFGTGVGYATGATEAAKEKNTHAILQKALKQTFAPEFLNRIDDIIYFNSLDKENIIKIIDIELNKLFKRVQQMGKEVQITESAKEFLADIGWDKSYGARPLKRVIQKHVEDLLSEALLTQPTEDADKITIDYDTQKEEIILCS